jgi:hypothetical protein
VGVKAKGFTASLKEAEAAMFGPRENAEPDTGAAPSSQYRPGLQSAAGNARLYSNIWLDYDMMMQVGVLRTSYTHSITHHTWWTLPDQAKL